MQTTVTVPRLNANEDEYKLVGVHVKEGSHVSSQDLLFEIESTKAASEIYAPSAGVVSNITTAQLGDFVGVGSPLCQIT